MIHLTNIIYDAASNSIEVTWSEVSVVQATDATNDAPREEVVKTPVRCHSYADVQMDWLEADLGDDLPAHADLIALVRSKIVPYVPPPLTPADIESAMDQLFEQTAKAKRYDSRATCALRAGYPGPYQAEGLAFATWMDAQNAKAYALLAQVKAGKMPMPESVEAALALLDPMEWPT